MDPVEFARTLRDAFGPGVTMKFLATDDGQVKGNPAWDQLRDEPWTPERCLWKRYVPPAPGTEVPYLPQPPTSAKVTKRKLV